MEVKLFLIFMFYHFTHEIWSKVHNTFLGIDSKKDSIRTNDTSHKVSGDILLS